MTCQACSMKIEKGLSKLNIVEDVSVNLMSKTVTVTVVEEAKIEGILGIIKRLGFKPKREELKIEKNTLNNSETDKIISELKQLDTVIAKEEENFLVIKYLPDVISLN